MGETESKSPWQKHMSISFLYEKLPFLILCCIGVFAVVLMVLATNTKRAFQEDIENRSKSELKLITDTIGGLGCLDQKCQRLFAARIIPVRERIVFHRKAVQDKVVEYEMSSYFLNVSIPILSVILSFLLASKREKQSVRTVRIFSLLLSVLVCVAAAFDVNSRYAKSVALARDFYDISYNSANDIYMLCDQHQGKVTTAMIVEKLRSQNDSITQLSKRLDELSGGRESAIPKNIATPAKD